MGWGWLLCVLYRVGGRGSTPLRLPNVVAVCLSILDGDGGSGQSPVNVGGGAGTVLQLVGTGDPFDLTGLEVRAGSEGEAHRVGCG